MPTFCRHNRFLANCTICSSEAREARETAASRGGSTRRAPSHGAAARRGTPARVRSAPGISVRREQRAGDDGYRSDLAAGLRASADAERLAEEIAFSCGRLLVLAAAPPGPYAQARSLAADDPVQASWICFVTAYLSPLETEEPFAGIARVLAGEDADLAEIPLGPRTSHDPARGAQTLDAYRQWVRRAADGSPAAVFAGDPSWTPQRRFERFYDRLALPGLTRAARYELLVSLGRLGIADVDAGSLQLVQARGEAAPDAALLAAKRVFGIGDPLLLERRAAALAAAASVPLAALDLALANWGAGQRATMGVASDVQDEAALQGARGALGL